MKESRAVEQFKALGDPVRWSIVLELRASKRSARVLADAVAVSPTLLSHHLKVLREAGLVAGVRRGRWIDYSVDKAALAGLAGMLNGHSEPIGELGQGCTAAVPDVPRYHAMDLVP